MGFGNFIREQFPFEDKAEIERQTQIAKLLRRRTEINRALRDLGVEENIFGGADLRVGGSQTEYWRPGDTQLQEKLEAERVDVNAKLRELGAGESGSQAEKKEA